MIHFVKVVKNLTEKEFETVASCKLFCGGDRALLAEVLKNGCSTRCFSSGESVCEPGTPTKMIGIILSGKAAVTSADSERKVLLRMFSSGDIFGVSGVFSKDCEFVTRISAKSDCSVAFISAEALSRLIENDKTVLYNYIEFLSGRIRFLNKKIKFFTSGSAERRLATYLDSFGEDSFRLNESMSALADMLDIGRASLYRAFDRLTADGFIIRERDSITLMNREKMIIYYNDK